MTGRISYCIVIPLLYDSLFLYCCIIVIDDEKIFNTIVKYLMISSDVYEYKDIYSIANATVRTLLFKPYIITPMGVIAFQLFTSPTPPQHHNT